VAPPHQNSNRNRIANFTAATRHQPKTIEFRQARGSLCAEEVMLWVKSCIGLVRLAQLCHDDLDKFPIKNWENERDAAGNWEWGDINVFDLIEDMKLGDDEKVYWTKRLALWQAGEPDDADDRINNELPPPEPIGSPSGSESGWDPPGGLAGTGGPGPESGPGGSGSGDSKKDDNGNTPGDAGQGMLTRGSGFSACKPNLSL
jgi:hypothetical protein